MKPSSLLFVPLTCAAFPAAALAQPVETSTGAASAAAPESVEPDLGGLSWTISTGGVPEAGALIFLEMGFSGLPRVSYHHTIAEGLSIGGLVSFDYSGFRPEEAFDGSVVIGVPIRYRPALPFALDLGLRATAGVRLLGPSDHNAILLDVGASFGFAIERRFIIGGGIDMPIAIAFGGTGNAVLYWPLLVGPILEFHVTPPLALTFDVKVGPHLATHDTDFGLRAHLGVAYRLF
jgi:hypothetical protein